MADKKLVTNVLSILTPVAAAAVVPVVKIVPVVTDYVIDKINEKKEADKNLVKVPDLYLKNSRMSIEEAKDAMERKGLKVILNDINKPNIKYKDCVDLQVVKIHPKCNQKVELGSHIIIKYVTSDVIEKSKKLFDEIERKKAEKKEKASRNVDTTLKIVKKGVGDITTDAGDKLKKIKIRRISK